MKAIIKKIMIELKAIMTRRFVFAGERIARRDIRRVRIDRMIVKNVRITKLISTVLKRI